MAWAVLQSVETTTDTTSLSATYTSNLTAGTKLIAAVAVANTEAVTVSDGTNGFVSLTGYTPPTSGSKFWLFALDTPGGDVGTKPTISVSGLTTTSGAALMIAEVSGLLTGNTTAMLACNDAAVQGNWSVLAGAAFSHVQQHDELGGMGPGTSLWTYRVQSSTDVAPTIADTQAGRISWVMFVAYPDIGGYYARIDNIAIDLPGLTPQSSYTPNAAAAMGVEDLSVIFNGSAGQQAGANAVVYTPPGGWIVPANGSSGYGGDALAPSSLASCAYNDLDVGGVIGPGAETLSAGGVTYSNVYHVLLVEYPPGTAVSAPETGTGADAQQLTVLVSSSDGASGAEAGIRSGITAGTDAGSGTDQAVSAGALSADAGTGAEAGAVSASLAAADVAAGSEASFSAVADLDTGSGAEAQKLLARVSLADTGTGSELQSYQLANVFSIASSDAAHGQEGDVEGYAVADAAAGVDTQSLTGLPADTELASGYDSQFLTIVVQAVSDVDAGSGYDDVTAPHMQSDAGTGLDVQGSVPVVQADTGTAAEQQSYVLGVYPYPPLRGGQVYLAPWRIERARYGGTLQFVSSADAGTASESTRPVASVDQYATGAAVTVLLSGAS